MADLFLDGDRAVVPNGEDDTFTVSYGFGDELAMRVLGGTGECTNRCLQTRRVRDDEGCFTLFGSADYFIEDTIELRVCFPHEFGVGTFHGGNVLAVVEVADPRFHGRSDDIAGLDGHPVFATAPVVHPAQEAHRRFDGSYVE